MPFKTSIILCTYNEAKYIENTIAQLEKNIPNLEIIIVDDNSTDGTVEIIKRLNKKLIRPSKTVSLVGNTYKANKTFNFKIKTNLDKLISIMMDNDLKIELNGK